MTTKVSDLIEILRDSQGTLFRCLVEGCGYLSRTLPVADHHALTHIYEESYSMTSGVSREVFEALARDIEDGDWDDYLLPLAKACMERSNTMRGKPGKQRLVKTVQAQEHEKFMGAAIPPNLLITPQQRIQPAPFAADKCVTVNGKSYRRQDLRGKFFRLRPGTLRGEKYNGIMVKITGAGEQKLQIAVPNSISDGVIDMKDGTSAIYLPYSRVEYLFA